MEFLKYFISEDIYLVPDHRGLKAYSDKEQTIPVDEKVDEKKPTFPLTVFSDSFNDEEKNLLNAILKAVNLQPEHIQVINNPGETPDSQKFLIFGINSYNNIPPYKPTEVDGVLYLKAHTLSDINQDVNKKKDLWNCMKQMFNV